MNKYSEEVAEIIIKGGKSEWQVTDQNYGGRNEPDSGEE